MLPLYTDPYLPGAFWAVYIGLFVFGLIVALIGYVITSWFLMKVFEKAGVEGKWRAWVPIYNTMVFAKLGDLNPWWILVLWGAAIVLSWVPVIGWLIGVAAFVYMVLAAYRVGQKLQKEGAWVVLYIFLSIVWLGIMAFDRSRWNTAVPPAGWANTFLADNTVWAGIPQQTPAGGYPAAPGYAAPGYPAPGYPAAPPAGYSAPPAGPAAPPAPPAGYTPPPAPPAAEPPAPAAEPPVDPSADPDAPRA